jgi:hypothetical protein
VEPPKASGGQNTFSPKNAKLCPHPQDERFIAAFYSTRTNTFLDFGALIPVGRTDFATLMSKNMEDRRTFS